ncbi:aspartic peptidase domain-containing protein [Mycena metata]|uniref:Aspartic peptidase domain-containing protein n=1 Tax=Mycena metata TaxID=1033252 RepID=A0AAD7HVB8_9AGAR|nr:aspartic peptidase domain-containing protein [Mycena metata]
MWFPVYLLLLVAVNCANSLVLHGRRLAPRTGKGATFTSTGSSNPWTNTLTGTQDRYATNITVSGQNFLVAIDTGSSDLWISPKSHLTFTNSGINTSIVYATSAVNGTIGFASVQVGPYGFSPQAFLVSSPDQVGLGGILDESLDGLIGFGFDGTSESAITLALGKSDTTVGQPFLFNMFDSSPDQENFIAISLSRTDDLEGSADASFTINELDDTYAAVNTTPPIGITPPDGQRWMIPLDGITVNGNAVALTPSKVAQTPSGKMAVLLDTGTPTAGVPTELLNAIYGNIPRALYSASQKVWVVPCNTTAIVTLTFGGRPFPIHPLDLSTIQIIEGVTVCTNAIAVFESDTAFDALFGDTIMRNVYSVFNFGSAIAKSPTRGSAIQLLSQTNATTAIADVTNVRMATLAASPPEGIPDSFQPLSFIQPPAVNAVALANGSSDESEEGQLQKWAPIVIGLLGANLVILLVLVAIGAVMCVKRGGKSGARVNYTPVQFSESVPTAESCEEKRYSD